MCNHLLRGCSKDVIKSVQAWRVCARLATDSRFTDFQARRELCSFALLYCDDDDDDDECVGMSFSLTQLTHFL